MNHADTQVRSRTVSWWALAGVIGVGFNVRTAVTSLPPLIEHVTSHYGPALNFAYLGMIPALMFSLWGILTPRIISSLGVERATMIAMLCAAVGTGLRTIGDNPVTLLTLSALALAGMGMGNVVLPALVKKYFPHRISTVSAIYITFIQIGTTLPALVAVPLAQQWGWKIAATLWVVPALLAIIPWLSMSKLPLRHPPLQPAGHITLGFSQLATIPRAWMMAIFFAANSACTYSIFTWFPAVAMRVGFEQYAAGAALAVFAATAIIPGFLAPLLAGKMRNPYPIVVISVLSYAACWIGLLLAPREGIWAWSILAGIGTTTFPLILALINLRTTSMSTAASLSGFAQSIGYACASAGPLAFGYFFHRTHSLLGAAAFMGSLLLVLLITGWFVCLPETVEEEYRERTR